MADLRATLEGDPIKARQRVKEVLPEPITATPHTDAAGLTSWTLQGLSSFEAVRVDLRSGEATNLGQVSRPVAGRVLNKRRSVDAMWCPRPGTSSKTDALLKELPAAEFAGFVARKAA